MEDIWQISSMRGIDIVNTSIDLGKKYRSSFEIMALILEAASTGASRFTIARRLNTNYANLGKYLDFLIKTGFINAEVNGGQISYKTCEKGFEFLRLYRVLLRMFSSGTRAKIDLICPPVHQSSSKI